MITSASQIQVHINGVEQILNTNYTVDLGNGIHTADETSETGDTTTTTADTASSADRVVFVTAPDSTDLIAITTIADNQYYNQGTDIILDM